MEALRSVGAITENEYTKDDVEQHIEPVREAIARRRDPKTLRIITRAMNDGAPEPEAPAPMGRSMTVDEIWSILQREVTDEAQAFHRTFEDAVLRGLYQARIIPRGSTTYNRRDLERGLDAVRESINTTPELMVTLMDPKFTSAESLRTISAAEVTKIIKFEGQTTAAFRLALDRLESFVIQVVGGPADERDVVRVLDRVREAWAQDVADAGAAAPILLGAINFVLSKE